MSTYGVGAEPPLCMELPVTTQRQRAMARRHGWLRAAYFHDDIVGEILRDSALAADPAIAASKRTRKPESPDAAIGANLPLDVVPNTLVSRRAHLGRSGIERGDQLITYEPATEDKLRDIFDPETVPDTDG